MKIVFSRSAVRQQHRNEKLRIMRACIPSCYQHTIDVIRSTVGQVRMNLNIAIRKQRAGSSKARKTIAFLAG